jgi:hypothetical protein
VAQTPEALRQELISFMKHRENNLKGFGQSTPSKKDKAFYEAKATAYNEIGEFLRELTIKEK